MGFRDSDLSYMLLRNQANIVFVLYLYAGGIIETECRGFVPLLEQPNSYLLLDPFYTVYECGIVVGCPTDLSEKWLLVASDVHIYIYL